MDETTKNRLIFSGGLLIIGYSIWKSNTPRTTYHRQAAKSLAPKRKANKVHKSVVAGWSCDNLGDCGDNPNIKYYKSLPEIEKEAVHYWRMHIKRGLSYKSKAEANRLLKNLINSDFVYTTTIGKDTSARLTNLGISFINSLDDVNFSQLKDCGDAKIYKLDKPILKAENLERNKTGPKIFSPVYNPIMAPKVTAKPKKKVPDIKGDPYDWSGYETKERERTGGVVR